MPGSAARGRPPQQEIPLPRVPCQPCRALESGPRLVEPAGAKQEVAPRRGQRRVARSAASPRSHRAGQPRFGPERHAVRHRPVELDHRRRHRHGQPVVERRQSAASRFPRPARRGHDTRRAPPAAHKARPPRRAPRLAPAPRAHGGSAAGPSARGSARSAARTRRPARRGRQARRLQLHQRQQAEDFGLLRHQPSEDAAQPLRLGAQRGRTRSSPAVAA